MIDVNRIKAVWQKLFGFTPSSLDRHAKFADIWEQPTPRVDAILAEIKREHERGLEWIHETQCWGEPKKRQRRRVSPNDPFMPVDIVRDVFPGAEVVGPGQTPEQWAAIEEEAARWRCDIDEVWHRRQVERGCEDCTKDTIPEWRRGGKIIEIIEANGTSALMCHYCGRRGEGPTYDAEALPMKCESCGKREAVSFSYFGNRNQGQPNGVWMLTCMCTANREVYYVMLDEFKKERSRWLSHLSCKTWMNWGDFQRVLDKFDSARGEQAGPGAPT